MAQTNTIDHMDALRDSFAQEFSTTKAKAKEMTDFLFNGLKDTLTENIRNADFRMAINKVGIFKAQQCKSKPGRNPATGEKITIAAKGKITFKPAKNIVDAGLN